MKDSELRRLFTDAYDQYADALFRHCYFRMGDRERGLELMQETFVKAWEYAAKGKEIEDIRAFLYRTANNLVIDFLRRKKLRREESLEDLQETGFDVASDEDVTAQTQKGFTQDQVTSVLSKVEEPYRSALIMRFIDELSPKQMAEALEISANTVSVRINRGMKKLEVLLRNYG